MLIPLPPNGGFLLQRPPAPVSRAVPSRRMSARNAIGDNATPQQETEAELAHTAPALSLWQRVGQSFNGAGIAFFARVVVSERSMAVPHLEVADLRQVRWDALAAAGFRGCIFDKDNTLTEPYRLELHPAAAAALADCTAAFDGRVVLYSNSAGLEQFDPEGTEAAALEAALGVPVLRHREKKPAGGPEDVERHFGCPAHRLIMIGDRYLTDIAFGNRLGMLTIRPEPFTAEGETRTVRAARAVEGALAGRSRAAGVPPPPHPLVPEGPQGLDQFLRDVGEVER